MSEEETKTMNKALFLNMVMMFSTSAMQQLGKIVNPSTGKTGVDLQGAQFFIDLLSMLKAKTENNLDRDEARLLKDTLATLQLNYVETAQEDGKAKPTTDKPEVEPAATRPPESAQTPPTESQPKARTDDNDQRFHKSYG